MNLLQFKKACLEILALVEKLQAEKKSLKSLCREARITIKKAKKEAPLLYRAFSSLKKRSITLPPQEKSNEFILAHEYFHLAFPEYHTFPYPWQEILAHHFAWTWLEKKNLLKKKEEKKKIGSQQEQENRHS